MSFNGDDGDFADFQNFTIQQDDETNNLNDLNDSDEDFADFQNADSVNVNKDDEINRNHNEFKQSSNETNKFELILKDAFPKLELNELNNVNKEVNQSKNIFKDLFIDESKKSLWYHIQNLEESPSLRLKWNKTESFQNFLSALKINLKQTLNNPHVPIFASSLGLSLLEPVKLKTDQVNEHHISNNVLNSKETESTDCSSTNEPLKSTSSLNSSNSIFDLENSNQNDQPVNFPVNGLIIKPNQTYDKLIKNIKQLPDNQKKNEEINSDTTNKILDELPILNFMRSNTLMFNQ